MDYKCVLWLKFGSVRLVIAAQRVINFSHYKLSGAQHEALWGLDGDVWFGGCLNVKVIQSKVVVNGQTKRHAFETLK